MYTVTKAAEVKLVELVESIESESASWRAIIFHFSQLQEHYRSQYQIKIAMNLVMDLMRQNQGGLFILEDFNLVIVGKGLNRSQLDKVIFQLRYLFADDPLAYGLEGEENPSFCDLYDLSVAFPAFESRVKQAVTQKIRRAQGGAKAGGAKEVTTANSDSTITPDSTAKTGFSPHMLASIERGLEKVDLSPVIRHQPICAAVPNMSIRQVYDEYYINIQHLRQLLGTKANLVGNRPLFNYLTQLLDLKMLALMAAKPETYLAEPISLNLNVDTLLSPHFAEFDAAIKPTMRVSIVIEIQLADVFADMAAFTVAREMVQQMGYRVCLDGLTTQTITQVDRTRLGFDLAKLLWNAEGQPDLISQENRDLAAAIQRCGANRMILCRCDSREAVEYGQAFGISLFQGRFLDHMIDPTAKVEN